MANTYSKKYEILNALQKAIKANELLLEESEALIAGDFVTDSVIKNMKIIATENIKDLKRQMNFLGYN